MEKYDVIIIGGGASGLCTAIMTKNEKNRVLILEHTNRVGKKILSTGNGKCNLTNLYCKVKEAGVFVDNPEGIPPYYSSDSHTVLYENTFRKNSVSKSRAGDVGLGAGGVIEGKVEEIQVRESAVSIRKISDNCAADKVGDDISLTKGFAEKVIASFDADAAVLFFKELGLAPLNKNGYIYPRSEQASAVLDLLRFRCEELGVDIVCDYQPKSIRRVDEKILLSKIRNTKGKFSSASLGQSSPDQSSSNTEEKLNNSGDKISSETPGQSSSDQSLSNAEKKFSKAGDMRHMQKELGKKQTSGFIIDDRFYCRKLVLATGGKSAAKTGSDGSGYKLARSLGHSIIKPVPGLCALQCSDPFFKELAGVRTDAQLSLFDMGKKQCENSAKKADTEASVSGLVASGTQENNIAKNPLPLMTISGNLQFTNYGISGIPVFQMSLIAARLLEQGHELLVKVNLLPEYSEEELIQILRNKESRKLLGILNKKLANVVEKLSYQAHPDEPKENYDEVFTHMIQKLKVHPIGTVAFDHAQTTLGGVPTKEINSGTMESRIVPGLYFTGEIIDVSGICGGYNLQWVWATAHAAANGIIK